MQLLQLGPDALANIAAVLRNPKHPRRLETSRFVLDKILPRRTTVEADVTVNPAGRDAETQAFLDDALIGIATPCALSSGRSRRTSSWNENPVPFVWTKTADEIVRKAVRR